MPRRNTRSNKGSGNRKGVDPDYLLDKYCPNPTPPKRSRPSPATPKPSAATTRTGRGGGDAGNILLTLSTHLARFEGMNYLS